MYVRCKACQGALWIPVEADSGRTCTATCRTCGQRHELVMTSGMRTKREELYQRARHYAAENNIDVPSACSVLYGDMDLGQVLDFQQGAPAIRAVAEVASPARRAGTYDPAFQSAIDEGLLTPAQAVARGKREVRAEQIADRHNVTIEVARDVVDNRVSLLEAVRGHRQAEPAPVRLTHPSKRSRFWVWGGIVLVVMVAAGGALWYLLPAQAGESTRTRYGTTEVVRDGKGQVVQVTGTDPESVLRAYCSASAEHRDFDPLGLIPSDQESALTRVGVLRNRVAKEIVLAISIHKDAETGRWSAGTGRAPVVAFHAPANAAASIPHATQAVGNL
jgi:hypothetical protein